jgi:hypothetical protein
MPLETSKALTFARTLTTIPDFPRIDESILQTRKDLQELVEDLPDEQAEARIRWLVKYMRHHWVSWTEWGGTAGMIALYRDEFEKIPELPPANGFQEPAEKPPADCTFCQDTGLVRTQTNDIAWCVCETAQAIARNHPEFIDLVRENPANVLMSQVERMNLMNLPPDPPKPRRRPIPINREPMPAIDPESAKLFERCPTCNGAGFKMGTNEYCNCALGRDLARVETRGTGQ